MKEENILSFPTEKIVALRRKRIGYLNLLREMFGEEKYLTDWHSFYLERLVEAQKPEVRDSVKCTWGLQVNLSVPALNTNSRVSVVNQLSSAITRGEKKTPYCS
jgi:hypothetical protein